MTVNDIDTEKLLIKAKNLTESIKFDKPNKKENCKIISSENVEELVNLLQNEAKVL